MLSRYVKKFAIALAIPAVALTSAATAHADEKWPNKSIRMIVGFAPGGPTDYAARFVAEALGKEMGTTIVVENKPGANGQTAVGELKRNKADGNTILFITSGSLSVAPARYKSLPFDVTKDFDYIGAVSGYPSVLVTNAQSSIQDVTQLVKESKERKDGLSAGTVSNTQELTLALFKQRFGVNAVGVPYKGDSQAMTDIAGGQLDFAFLSPSVAIPMIESGRVKAIGVTGQIAGAYQSKLARIQGLDVIAWNGIVTRKGTPEAINQQLGSALKKVLELPEFQAGLAKSGQSVMPIRNKEFEKFVLDEARMWEKVANDAGLEKL
ncbi:hypothetical protein SDC9_51765 [bioreactor metagenome]|uniref:Tripartite tricarboxylate transporter family receptor n=1 Tax=bioreactor metagenome TaxID=1076179 RepID=A0A644WNI9_9ZZZZ